MADPAPNARRVQFGAFEADLCAGELWKAGRKRRLAGQPFVILAILLERPGEIVSRDELQRRLWPDTFVDVDHNLNAAINKVREALDDSSDRPRFIETLPRRGYRFIAPVSPVPPLEGAGSQSTPAPPPLIPGNRLEIDATGNEAVAGTSAPAHLPSAHKRFKPWLWPVAAVVVLAVAWLLRLTIPPPEVTGVTQLTQDAGMKTIAGPDPVPMATDGSEIYFWESVGGQAKLRQVSAGGGEVIPVETAVPFGGVDAVSPTRRELLFRGPPAGDLANSPDAGKQGVWVLPLPGGQPHRVGNIAAYDATYAPDGNTIFYTTGHDIFTADEDGRNARKVLSVPVGFPFWPRISPDGRLLRFSVFDPALRTDSLWEARTDGRHLRRLLAGWETPGNECCGNWTSDGRYFVFQATHEGTNSLWAMREKGGWWRKAHRGPVRLTLGDMDSVSPLPGRDGTRIFFIGVARKGEIIRYQPSVHSFTPFLLGISAEGLAFSPDGKKIVYVSYPGSILWESNADGSDRHQLTFPPVEAGLPRWSPDGTQVVFSACQAGQPWQLFVVPAEGGDVRQLTSGKLDYEDGSWSPDGKSVAFSGDPLTARTSPADDIHILDVATGQVTDVPGSAHMLSPRWSPDGRYLLTVAADSRKLFLYDFATGGWSVLADMDADHPSWSSDGKCVYFSETFTKALPVYRVCLADRKPEHIVDLSTGGTLVDGSFGEWTGLGPDDSILAARNIGTEEIYALNVEFPR